MKVIFLLFCSFALMFNSYAFPNQQNNHVFVVFNKQRTNQLYKTYEEIYKVTNSLLLDQDTRDFENVDAAPEIVDDMSHPRQDSAEQHGKHFEFGNSLSDLVENESPLLYQLFGKPVEKRNANERNMNSRKGIPKGKQKKAKALGRLLMNNGANKNNEDIQDDYADDEDDDYSKGLSNKKMNWEAFQNEDGPSVLELIALNARHKTNVYST